MTCICERLSTEADLCRNDGADDIAALLDAARKEIDRLRGMLDVQRTGLAELKAMLVAEKPA